MSYKTLEKVHIIRNRLKTAYSRQKSYAYHNRRDLEFEEGDKVYLKFSPMQGVVRFCKKGKLHPCYVGPFEILQKIGRVASELKFSSELALVHPVFHVFILKKCIGDPKFVLPIEGLNVMGKLSYEEVPVEMLYRRVKRLRNREVASVKVL